MNFKLYRVGDGTYRLWHEAAGAGDKDVMIEIYEYGAAVLIEPGTESKRPVEHLGRLLVLLYQDRMKASEV